MGENMKVRRGLKLTAMTSNIPQDSRIVFGGYAHGDGNGMGRIAAILALKVSNSIPSEALKNLPRQLSQQIVGFNPLAVSNTPGIETDRVLMEQDFMFGGGKVSDVLAALGEKHHGNIEIIDFKRWEVGSDS